MIASRETRIKKAFANGCTDAWAEARTRICSRVFSTYEPKSYNSLNQHWRKRHHNFTFWERNKILGSLPLERSHLPDWSMSFSWFLFLLNYSPQIRTAKCAGISAAENDLVKSKKQNKYVSQWSWKPNDVLYYTTRLNLGLRGRFDYSVLHSGCAGLRRARGSGGLETLK